MKTRPRRSRIATLTSLALLAAPSSHAEVQRRSRPSIARCYLRAAKDGRRSCATSSRSRSRRATTTDDLLPSGQKVQFGGTVDLKIRRPDRLRMDITGDRRNERLYYDGKTFTVFGTNAGYYATFPAPGPWPS